MNIVLAGVVPKLSYLGGASNDRFLKIKFNQPSFACICKCSDYPSNRRYFHDYTLKRVILIYVFEADKLS